MDGSSSRIIDANGNRAREALRVMEDYARFALDDGAISAELKQMRHDLAGALAPFAGALLTRDTPHDVGTANKTEAEFSRASLETVAIANAKRLSEALRVMEEVAKTIDADAARLLERLRYRGYDVEQKLAFAGMARDAAERFRKVHVYVLLTESVCRAGRPWQATLDAILATDLGARLCIQLREKDLAEGELLRRARFVSEKCKAAGALFIMNDRPDMALLAQADGVHLGQEDLPCAEVRKLLGPRAILGVSTERIEQARAAVNAGATYIATGPMFATTTKEKPRIAGPGYAAEAVLELGSMVPIVAIGGISLVNVQEVAATGVNCVAVSSCVLKAEKPADVVRALAEAAARRSAS